MALTLNGTTGITSPGGDTSTSLTTSGLTVGSTAIGAGNATRFKNRIINGDMRIDQRNAGASVTPTSGSYTLDRWAVEMSQASKFTVQQNAGSLTPVATTGFTNYLGITSTSAYTVGASEYFVIGQAIEGYNIADLGFGTASAKTVTLSFWVYSSLTGTFGGTLLSNAATRNYVFSYTINSANTWEYKTITVSGDTSGTWLTNNGAGLFVRFCIGAGSSVTGAAGSWSATVNRSVTGQTSVVGTNGATFYITGVQLEVGSSATGFEYVDYTTQLLMCQRYYYKHNASWGSCLTATTPSLAAYPLKVTMRAQPTMDSGAVFTASAGSAGTPAVYSSTGTGTDGNVIYVYNSSSNWTTTAIVLLNAGFSAEL